VSGTGYCENATDSRKEVTVTVNPLVTADDITATGTTICSGKTASLTASSSIPDATYIWYSSQTETTVLNTGATYTTPTLNATTAYYVSVSGTGYCENATDNRKEVTVTVNPLATAADITVNDTTICSGTTANLRASSSIPDATCKWYSSQDAAEPFHTGNIYTTPALSADTVYYISLAGDNICENAAGERREVKITVNPSPKLTSTRNFDAIYSSSLFTYHAESTIEKTQINWKRDSMDEIKQQASTGSTGEISETLSNTGTAPVEVEYVITMISPEGCVTVDTLKAKVNPVSEPPALTGHPADTTYCVCEKDLSCKLAVTPQTDNNNNGGKLFYQWYRSAAPEVEGGEAVPDATDSIFYTPAGLTVGTYYYYCRVSSEYSPEPVYSKIATVTVEPDIAGIANLEINGRPAPVYASKLEYMALCGEDSVVIDVAAASKYAGITVDGVEYSAPTVIYLNSDVTTVIISVETCDRQIFEYTLTITKSILNLIYQRFYNSLGVDRNPEYNGGYADIRGVRWYYGDDTKPFKTDTVENMKEAADKNISRNWVIKLNELDPSLYSAEVNIAGEWHKACGNPVTADSKIIVYPNPASAGENITVKLPFDPSSGYMNIFTASGALVKQNIPLTSENSIISVANFSAGTGTYILQVICHRKEGNLNKQDSFKLIVY
jgi:hypothetical protein